MEMVKRHLYIYAQFFIDHMDNFKEPSILLATTRLMRPKGNSFGQIDHKRRQNSHKNTLQGHAEDEQIQVM